MLADEIREFVYQNYILPAINRGEETVEVRAGDVHSAMKLKDAMPAVCGALGTKKFEEQYSINLVDREGPTQGANVFFTFKFSSGIAIETSEPEDASIPQVSDKYRGTQAYLLTYCELIRAAQYRGVLTYPQIAAIMGLPHAGSHMAKEVGCLVGAISEDEVRQSRPMLSVLVVSSVTGKPGKGFYVLARELGRLDREGEDAEHVFWQKEKVAVYETWSREKRV